MLATRSVKCYSEIAEDFRRMVNPKTKDFDRYNRRLIRERVDVTDLKAHVLEDSSVHRTYFQVFLGLAEDEREQFAFIEENAELLQDWWHVDQLLVFVRKPLDYAFALQKAKAYTRSELPFLRRWGYVLFLAGLQKTPEHAREILSLLHDDGEYYVQMAQAWLIADLAVFNIEEVLRFLKDTDLPYPITGKVIQKICDSFRISEANKSRAKALRARWKAKRE